MCESIECISQVASCREMGVTWELLMQEDGEFKVSLGYIMSSRPV